LYFSCLNVLSFVIVALVLFSWLKVNKIKSTMNSAKVYVNTDIIERLTRPLGNNGPMGGNGNSVMDDSQPQQMFDSQIGNERPVMDMNSFMNGLAGGGSGVAGEGAGSQTPGRSLSRRNSSGGKPLTEEERKKKAEQFQLFLQRQEATKKKKEEQVKQVGFAYLFFSS
jgi:hypothetical protein